MAPTLFVTTAAINNSNRTCTKNVEAHNKAASVKTVAMMMIQNHPILNTLCTTTTHSGCQPRVCNNKNNNNGNHNNHSQWELSLFFMRYVFGPSKYQHQGNDTMVMANHTAMTEVNYLHSLLRCHSHITTKMQYSSSTHSKYWQSALLFYPKGIHCCCYHHNHLVLSPTTLHGVGWS